MIFRFGKCILIRTCVAIKMFGCEHDGRYLQKFAFLLCDLISGILMKIF